MEKKIENFDLLIISKCSNILPDCNLGKHFCRNMSKIADNLRRERKH